MNNLIYQTPNTVYSTKTAQNIDGLGRRWVLFDSASMLVHVAYRNLNFVSVDKSAREIASQVKHNKNK